MTKLTDQEVIRKGVELADNIYPWDYWKKNLPYAGDSIEWHQIHTDALAAQLVRQVDEKGLDLVCRNDETYIEDSVVSVASCMNNGRTMNTLRCIVESGVLG